MRAWTSPDVPRLPGRRGPAVRVFDTSRAGPPSSPRPPTAPRGCTSAGSRRTTPPTWATPRRTSPSTCSTARGAAPATTCATCRTSPTSTTRCSSAPTATGEDWVALAERETELFRTDMEALRVLPPDAYVGAVEAIPLVVAMVEQLQRGRARVRRRRRPLLLGDRRPGLRRGLRLGRASRCWRSSPSAGETPTGPARRTRWTACSGRPSAPASRRGTHRFGRGRPGWHIECSAIARAPPRHGDRRPGRRQRPGLPAPRDERLRGAGGRPGAPVRPRLRARRHGRPRRREDVEVQGQPGAGLHGSARAASTRWRSGCCCSATTTAATGMWDDADLAAAAAPPATLARRRRPPAGAADRGRSSTRVLAALADDLDAPARPASCRPLGQPPSRRAGARRRRRVRTPSTQPSASL